jgi:excisionase family DNA binding protein
MEDKLLSLADAAAYLGRSRMTVQRHITAGNLTAERVGHVYVIRQSELDRFKALDRPSHRPRKPPAAPPGPGAA